mgnify:FL=1
MLELQGKAVYQAISIGPLAILKRAGDSGDPAGSGGRLLDPDRGAEAPKQEDFQPAREMQRFHTARGQAIEALRLMAQKAKKKLGDKEAAIFQVQQMMLEEEDFLAAVESHIQDERVSAEEALGMAAREFVTLFSELEDPYMRARAADIRDITRQVLDILTRSSGIDPFLYEDVILAADSLTPSETMQLHTDKLLGVITADGSPTSHMAILARTLGLATVVGTQVEIPPEYDGKLAIIDGYTGRIYLDPDEKTLRRLEKKKRDGEHRREELEEVRGQETRTRDGRRVRLYANAGSLEDLDQVLANDAEGIGLFRSEFIYLDSVTFPTEEQQYWVYKTVLEKMGDRPVVIRTLDIGADKQLSYLHLDEEDNPALGMRAVRLCLTRPELFRTQLRALCRASQYGNLSIMFPMIISLNEVRLCKQLLQSVQEELDREGSVFDRNMQVGIMIETPAAALMSGELAEEADFFSIGTNDLTQYTLAIDRTQTRLDQFFDAHHPAVLKLIELTVENAHHKGIPCGICGELGADRDLTETFLRWGIDELSVAPTSVLPLRSKVRSIRLNPKK